jgi:ATP-dependent RNA helicase HelY
MSKWDGVSRRPLIPNEFQQMAGRAGRRGIDEQGHVVIPYSPFVTFHEALNIATGPLHPVESAFTIRYNTVLNLWDNPTRADRDTAPADPDPDLAPPQSEERVLRVMRSSLLQFQQRRRLRELEETLEEEEAHLAELPVGCLIGYENGEELLDEYERLGRVLDEARRREKKLEQNLSFLQAHNRGLPWQRPERDQIRRAFRTMPPGSVVHLENAGWAIYLGRGLGAVVGIFLELGPQNVDAIIDVSHLLGEVMALTEYRRINFLPSPEVSIPLPDALTTLAVLPTLPLDRMLSPGELHDLQKAAAEALANLPDIEAWISEYRATQAVQTRGATERAQSELAAARQNVRESAEAERVHVCHACPVRKEHKQIRRQRARLMLDRDSAEKRLAERSAYEDTRLQKTLRGLVSVLVRFSYIRAGSLTHKAKKLADIFDSNALMIVEMIEGNYLEGLQPEDLAEVFSWFAYDRDIDFPNRLLLPRFIVNLRRELDDLQNAIFQAERRHDLRLTPGYNPFFYGAARAWCKGTSLGEILEAVDMSEGDMVMTFNKTLDIMRQVRDMFNHQDPEHPILPALRQADKMMRRGVVEMANTMGFAPVDDAAPDAGAETPASTGEDVPPSE